MNKYSIARKHKPDRGGATCNYVKPILKPECLVAASLLASSVCGHQILASLRAELVALPMHSAQCEFHPAMKQQQHQECDIARQLCVFNGKMHTFAPSVMLPSLSRTQ